MYRKYQKDNVSTKLKAPRGHIIDDRGDIIKGEWTRVNGGHGDFSWRFQTEPVSDDDE